MDNETLSKWKPTFSDIIRMGLIVIGLIYGFAIMTIRVDQLEKNQDVIKNEIKTNQEKIENNLYNIQQQIGELKGILKSK